MKITILILLITIIAFIIILLRFKSKAKISIEETKLPVNDFKNRLKLGLNSTRQSFWEKIKTSFREADAALSAEQVDHLEEVLYTADIGVKNVDEIIRLLKNHHKPLTLVEVKQFLFDYFKEKLTLPTLKTTNETTAETQVIMIVGVNGAGKTTTIGKLATRLANQNHSVVVGACDTFRAAAVDQLQVWCDRAKVKMVRGKENSSPSGVAYESLNIALNEKANYCILDTAGRLHTKENLMDELLKLKNVLKKLSPNAPHQTLLVLDAISGQNAIKQAQEFHQKIGLDGIIFTKCDGSSKAGSAISIVQELQIPIVFIGVGEDVEDLDLFNADDYLHALLGS